MLSELSNLSQDDYFGRRFVGKFQQVEKGKLSGLGSQSGDSHSAWRREMEEGKKQNEKKEEEVEKG